MGFLVLPIVVVLFSVELSYSGQLSLLSSSANGSYCPGIIKFTCIGRKIPVTFDWKINGSVAGMYAFRTSDNYPVSILPLLPLPTSVVMDVLSASSEVYFKNIMAVLKGDMTDLRGSTIQCSSQSLASELYFVKARVPEWPSDVDVQPTYDVDTLFLSRIVIQWTVKDLECSQVSYIVTLENITGGIENQMMKLCEIGTLCTIFFSPPSSDQIYRVRIIAINGFGEYSAKIFLSKPIASTVGLCNAPSNLTSNPASHNCRMTATISAVSALLAGVLCGVAAGILVGVTAYIKWHKIGKESQPLNIQPICAARHYEEIQMATNTRPHVEPELQLNVAYGRVKTN